MPPLGRLANPQLTREQVLSVLVQPLMQQNVFLAAGPELFDSDGSQIRIPKLQGSTPPGWYAENEQIGESDVEFDSIILLPPTLKSVKVLVPMSNEILRQSVIALEAALRDRLVYDVSKQLDYAFFEGDGLADANGNKVPLGMLNWSAVSEVQRVTIFGSPTGGNFTLTFRGQTTANIARNAAAAAVTAALEALSTIGAGNVVASGGPGPDAPWDVTFAGTLAGQNVPHLKATHALTGGTTPHMTVTTTTPGRDGAQSIDLAAATPDLDDLHDMIGLALAAYATPDRWFMTPRVFTTIRKLKDGYGRFQLQPDPKAENQFQLFGMPVSITNHLAPGAPLTGNSTIALVDMSQIAVGRDLEPSVRVLDQTRGDKDQTLIRVVTRYDVAPRNAKGVVLATNVAAAV